MTLDLILGSYLNFRLDFGFVQLYRQLPSPSWYFNLDYDPKVESVEILNWIYDHNFDFDLDFSESQLIFNPVLDSCLDVRLVIGDYLDLQPGPSPNWDFEIDFGPIKVF